MEILRHSQQLIKCFDSKQISSTNGKISNDHNLELVFWKKNIFVTFISTTIHYDFSGIKSRLQVISPISSIQSIELSKTVYHGKQSQIIFDCSKFVQNVGYLSTAAESIAFVQLQNYFCFGYDSTLVHWNSGILHFWSGHSDGLWNGIFSMSYNTICVILLHREHDSNAKHFGTDWKLWTIHWK